MTIPGFTAGQTLSRRRFHLHRATFAHEHDGRALVHPQDCRCPSKCPGPGGTGNCICGCVNGACVCNEGLQPVESPRPREDFGCFIDCVGVGVNINTCARLCLLQ